MPAATINASNTPDLMELLKIGIQVIGYGVTWWIVFRGWRESRQQNQERDERKELRDLVNDIADSIRNIESDTVSYLTSPDEHQSASYWTVLFGVRQLNTLIVSCTQFDTQEINARLMAYRQALTSKALSGPTSPKPVGRARDTVLREVSQASVALVRSLEKRYRDLYPFKGLGNSSKK